MADVRVPVKIGGGFALIGLILLTIVIWSYFSSQRNVHLIDESIVMSRQTSMLKEMKFCVAQVQQWLTDISATRGLDGLNDGFEQAENYRNKFYEKQSKLLSEYKERNETDLVSDVENLAVKFDVYYEVGKKMAQGYINGGPETGNKMMGDFDEAASALQDTLTPVVEGEIKEYQTIIANASSVAKNSSRNTTIVGLFAVFLSVVLAFFITRAVTLPIRKASGQLNEGADQVNNASGHISMASQSLAEGASEQAASLEETSSSLEELVSMTRQNAENANQADNLMKEANAVVVDADKSMGELTKAMVEISTASEETSKIIKTIDEIAFQTNLLALNAAVEAARAGEAGAGFAVVADEVRNLAMRAAEAAKDTGVLIEGTVDKVKRGAELVSSTDDAFSKVAERAKTVGVLVGEISVASTQQDEGLTQINTAVSQMDQVTQQNAASAEESAAAAEELNAQAEQMLGFVNDLVVLVDGKDNKDERVSRKMVDTTAPAVKAPKQLSVQPEQKIAPEKIIPMGEAF